MAVLRLDNQQVGQTSYRACSQQCWDQRFNFDLDRVSNDSLANVRKYSQIPLQHRHGVPEEKLACYNELVITRILKFLSAWEQIV